MEEMESTILENENIRIEIETTEIEHIKTKTDKIKDVISKSMIPAFTADEIEIATLKAS